MLPLRLWSCKERGQFLPMARSAHTDLSSFRKSGQLASITGRSKLSGIDLARKRRTCMTHCQLMSAGFVCIFRPRPCKSFNVSAPIFGITSRRFAIYWSPSRGCQRFLIILEIMPFKQSNILLVAILAILFQGKSNVKVAFGMHLEACQLQLRHVER